MSHKGRITILAMATLLVAQIGLATEADENVEALIPKQDEIIDISVDIQPTVILVGQQANITFSLTYPEGTRVYFPQNPEVSPLKLVSQSSSTSAVLGQGTNESHTLVVLPVRPGQSSIAPIEIAYVTPDGQSKIAKTPKIDLTVSTTLGDEVSPELTAPGAPVQVRVRNTPLIWALSGLGIAIAAAILAIIGYRLWRRWKDAHKPLPPPIPAHEQALAALAKLEALLSELSWPELALGVSEIIREFLGQRLGFNGVEATTYEVMRNITGKSIGTMTPERIEDLLSLCDLIKFAKFQPSQQEGMQLIPRSRDLVYGVIALDSQLALDERHTEVANESNQESSGEAEHGFLEEPGQEGAQRPKQNAPGELPQKLSEADEMNGGNDAL